MLVAECPLCKCKSLGPLSLILGNPYGNLEKNNYNFELKLHKISGPELFYDYIFCKYVVIPDILLQLCFRRFKLESRQGWTFFVVEVLHPQGIDVQAGSLYPIFVPYSTLYSTAITWLQVWARPSIQLLHETTISCLLFKAISTSRASFLILCEGDTRDVTPFGPFRDV